MGNIIPKGIYLHAKISIHLQKSGLCNVYHPESQPFKGGSPAEKQVNHPPASGTDSCPKPASVHLLHFHCTALYC